MYIHVSSESEGDINNKLLANTAKTKTVMEKRWGREGIALSYLPTTENTSWGENKPTGKLQW